jgi:hypothetical protein
MKSITVLVFCLIFLSTGCQKDKECDPSCGPLQLCSDGICTCPNDNYVLGNSCVDNCEDCFEGLFDCGCIEKYIFDISKFDDSASQVVLHYVIPGTISITNASSDVTKLSEHTYRFDIPRSCDIGDKKSTNIEFTVDKSEPSKLKVQARYHILPSNETLGTCETVFTK